jgi:hypothetical protein
VVGLRNNALEIQPMTNESRRQVLTVLHAARDLLLEAKGSRCLKTQSTPTV